MKRVLTGVAVLFVLSGCADSALVSSEESGADLKQASPSPLTAAGAFSAVIPLPTGFQPEGIAVGTGTTFYVGLLISGAIYRGDLRTGEGAVFVPPAPAPGRTAVGLSYDRRSDLLFVAGGALGTAYVYDAATGQLAAAYQLTSPGSFINDVVVTRTAAYFTDSFRPALIGSLWCG